MSTDTTIVAANAEEADALERDLVDPLARFRERFHLLPGRVYLDGNSLGLLSRDAEAETLAALAQWKMLGIDGWLGADPPWFTLGEELGALTAPLVGAEPEEVVVTGTTTVNLHALVATFYRPRRGAPQDRRHRARLPLRRLRHCRVPFGCEGAIRSAISCWSRAAMGAPSTRRTSSPRLTDTVALAVLPSVLYRSGQLLDMPRLTAAARERDVIRSGSTAPTRSARCRTTSTSGASISPSGAPTSTSTPDRAASAGSTSIAATWEAARAWPAGGATTRSASSTCCTSWEGAANAGAWQICTPPLLATAPLLGSLRLFARGRDRPRAREIAGADGLPDRAARGARPDRVAVRFPIGTPREPERRGGHVAVEHEERPASRRRSKLAASSPIFARRTSSASLRRPLHLLPRAMADRTGVEGDHR